MDKNRGGADIHNCSMSMDDSKDPLDLNETEYNKGQLYKGVNIYIESSQLSISLP
jgi:hypothetical protein